MPDIWSMLAAYAIAFGLQNDKVKPLSDGLRVIPFFARMLSCSYCTGFHCGWMVWVLSWAITGVIPASGWHAAPSILLWALASAAFSYVLDAVVQRIETHGAENSTE